MSKEVNIKKVIIGAGLLVGALAYTAIQNAKRKQEVIDISSQVQEEIEEPRD